MYLLISFTCSGANKWLLANNPLPYGLLSSCISLSGPNTKTDPPSEHTDPHP